MLENESLWRVVEHVHEKLERRNIHHAAAGGVAVSLHGYRRNTVDLNLLIRREDAASLRAALESDGFVWDVERSEYHSPAKVPVQILLAGDLEGPGQEATFPDPADAKHVTEIEGVPVLSLAQLIQGKIACGSGDLRRTHKDFADVVELIVIHGLDGSFARHLHKSTRKAFRQLVRRVG